MPRNRRPVAAVPAAAGPVLEVLTPDLLADVFGVRASAARHTDGVVRLTYAARPLAHDPGHREGERVTGRGGPPGSEP
jgi:iron complex transport system ATP-binding protein